MANLRNLADEYCRVCGCRLEPGDGDICAVCENEESERFADTNDPFVEDELDYSPGFRPFETAGVRIEGDTSEEQPDD